MKRAIKSRIDGAMGVPCEVRFEIVDDIPPTSSGKHLYSVTHVV